MPLQAPELDDRRFADIFAEARSLIPRYAPEWTDHNESDPGITLIQMFAWMTDMLLYRLNQVPERNYIKFLQLLGIELEPAQPAHVDLTFTLARDDLELAIVPKGVQVAAAGDDGAEPVVFELDQALVAIGAKLKAIQVFDGFSYTVETTKNATTGQWYAPFGSQAREGSALLLGFASPLAFTSQPVSLMAYLAEERHRPANRNCEIDLAGLPAPATLAWEYFDGAHWEPLSLNSDGTRAFTRSGSISFDGPGTKIKKTRLGNVADILYWVRCRLVRATYELAPRLAMVLSNTARATQALSVRDEVLGGSDGRPNQTYTLANTPVVVRERPEQAGGPDNKPVMITSLRLEVDEGSGFKVWQEVSDFYGSSKDSPHYTLNRTTGQVRFGDGERGRIPVANLANPTANIVARAYRFGGGKRGNVAAETVSGLQTFVDGIKSVTNRRPAYGGADEETIDQAKLRAPQELKSKGRAVTAEDFEFLALETPDALVRRAKALPLVHPNFPDARIPGVVSVIVVPESEAPNPMPNEATLAAVCAYLNCHRLLTSEVYVIPPTYHKVLIVADLVVLPDADLGQVRRAVDERLTRYFHPLYGGDGGAGWEFGHDIFYSEVYRVIIQTPGVGRIANNQLEIWLDNERQTFCRDVALEQGRLLYSEGHDVRVSY